MARNHEAVKNGTQSPLETASVFQKIFLTWLNPTILLGSRRPLENEDIPSLPPEHTSKETLAKFLKCWDEEVARNPTSPSFSRVAFRAFGWNFYLSQINFTLFLIATFLQPTFVQKILRYVQAGNASLGDIHSGIGFAIILGGLSFFQTIVFNTGFYNMQCFGLQIRPALIAALFHKSLRISNSARSSHPTGEILTLMSVDVERVWLATLLGNWLWMSPIMLTVAIILLYIQVGYPSLIVGFVLIFWGYFQEIVSGWVNSTRTKLVKCTGRRTMLTNEALQGIRVIKLYAWEEPSQERINDVRMEEMTLIRRYSMLRMMNTILQFLGPVVVAYILFLSFALIGGDFTVQKVYTAMAILNITRLPIALFPMTRTAAAEAANSINRIKNYLTLPELKPLEIQHGEMSQDKVVLVKIEDASFDWTEPNETDQAPSIETRSRKGSNASVQTVPHIPATSVDSYVDQYDMVAEGDEGIELSTPADTEQAINPTAATLEDIRSQNDPQHRSHSLRSVNLEINPGDLVAVIGPVGAGKTSLLSALLGQMTRIRGSQSLNCKVAYAGQEHWIQNLTLRDNVLFDEPFDEDRYAECLDASQLSTDLVNLPNADYTEIGERGINLSGGQKARVNLARALYASNVDLYLLDDILASVDVHVAKAIFDSAILELLKDSARVLVLSSNYHLLPHFNKIVVIQPDGLVSVCSSYLNLKQRYPEYVTPDADRKYEELLSAAVAAAAAAAMPEDSSSPSDSPPASSLSVAPVTDRREMLGGSNLPFNHSVWHVNPQKSSRLAFQSNRSSIFRSMKLEILEKQHQTSTLTTTEDREKGEVSLQAYISYFSIGLRPKVHHTSPSSVRETEDNPAPADSESANGVFVLIFLLLLFAIGQTFRVWTDLWVGIWAKGVEDDSHNRQFYLLIYSGLLLGSVIFVTTRAFYFMMRCMGTSEAMHFSLIKRVFSAPINTYFDVTPLGRILNRFSKDLDVIDCLLPDFFLNMLQNMCHVLSVIALCVASTPYFAIIFAPLAILFSFIQEFYRKTSRELKRLDAVSRSPLYTLFGETLVGLPTVRAYGREEVFMEKHHETSDRNGKNFFIFWCCSRWLAMRLDLISTVVVTAVGLIAVIMVNKGVGVSDNILGLALVYSLQLAGLLQWTVRTVIETENNMTSVERLLVFNSVQSEAQGQEKNDPSGQWPTEGAITFRNVSLCYRPGLPKVLNGVNLAIPGGIKVGVCGRTGAGKSSLMLALFRIVEAEKGTGETDSSIEIDGVNILNISLRTLRTQLTIIPQDPVMFSGSLRYNLDPFGSYSDQEIWEALERVHLKEDIIAKFPQQLSHEVSERGENISVGQRQLLCIARALLRKSKVIVMDEATASVDSLTDKKIQSTIRSEFHHCTILTIAHRLETIADYDRIVVMSAGQVAEYGPLHELLAMPGGQFKSLVDELGPEVKAQFLETARNRYDLNDLSLSP